MALCKSGRQSMEEFFELAANKVPLPADAEYHERIEHNRRMLLRALNLRTTVAMIGSGVSRAFGYPSWEDFAERLVRVTAEALPGNKRVEPLLQRLEDKTKKPATDLMFFLGTCKEVLYEQGREDVYQGYLEKQFAQGTKTPGPCLNPFEPLLKLPIGRFITTNYDCEIEQALMNTHSLPAAHFDLDPRKSAHQKFTPGSRRHSFTQKATDQLASFALAGITGNENRVFHCHGRFDDPESVVATEADYQRWYLTKEDQASFAFQRSIEILLGSNPLLFIGYGLHDDDLLRPLRQLLAIDPEQKYVRPVFALLECSGEKDLSEHDLLRARYGLHAIPYESQGEKPDQKTKALCEALQNLGKRWHKARNEWFTKPKVKKPQVSTGKPNPHYEAKKKPSWQTQLAASAGEILRPGLSVLVGPSGSGKSLQAISLLEIAHQGAEKEGVHKYEGAFYWNTHYANEAVTSVDYALSYFDPEGSTQGSRYDRIQKLLHHRRFLLVIDGCERLLRRNGTAGTGVSYSATFHRLLNVFAAKGISSTVLLVGRLWPSDLDNFPTVRRFEIQRAISQEIREMEQHPFQDFVPKDVSALYSLLRGHRFGLELALHHLHHPKNTHQDLCALNQCLASRLPDHRLREMFRIVLQDVDKDTVVLQDTYNKKGKKDCRNHWGLASAFLERLAFFISPVCQKTLEVCYHQALESVYARQGKDLDPPLSGIEDERLHQLNQEAGQLRCRLVDAGLLIPMGGPQMPACSESEHNAYTVDATARRLLFQPHYGLSAEPLAAFGLSGFTSGRIGVDPDPSRCKQIGDLFDRLLLLAEVEPAESCRLCRDAFGLLRTRMEANTVPRWTSYGKYLKFGIRVARLAKKVSDGKFWTYCEHQDGPELAESPDTPLYATELAWLYNDIALALSAEGYILDAYAVWEQAHEICRLVEDPAWGGGFHQEVLLSLTFTFIEMGRLPAAKEYLEDAERLLLRFPDDDTLARILGLRGLMAHLGGDLQTAGDLYDRSLKLLRPGNNLRAQSVFLKHKADVMISVGNWSEADLLVRNSRALAEAGVFPELVANARISEGHLRFRRGDPVGARLEYKAVLSEAQRIGTRKLETRVLTALARVALAQKDVEGAHTLATQSLSLANELGLGLRQTHSLVVLGLTTLELGQRDLGIAYLREAKRLADIQEYWARSREAENKLLELGANW